MHLGFIQFNYTAYKGLVLKGALLKLGLFVACLLICSLIYDLFVCLQIRSIMVGFLKIHWCGMSKFVILKLNNLKCSSVISILYQALHKVSMFWFPYVYFGMHIKLEGNKSCACDGRKSVGQIKIAILKQ